MLIGAMNTDEKDNQIPITPIGITNWRDTNKQFGIKTIDRLRHIYAIGKTGVGKSTLLMNMAIADIANGNGICILDPHGDIAEQILHHIPEHRIKDVVYFNTADIKHLIAFNPLQSCDKSEHHLIATGLISTFKKIWAESWGPRLEYILHFSLLTLLEYGKATLLDIQPLLTDKAYRDHVVASIHHEHVKKFWWNEFDRYPYQLRLEAITPILNKIGTFITNEPLRNIISQQKSTIHIQNILEEGKILLCNLSKGAIGEEASSLLGSMLLSSLQLAALRRSSIPEHLRIPFFIYVDEMHSFITLSFADILAEARKYGLGLFLTHQYLEQLSEKIRSAILGNVGTLIVFRVGAEDAEYLSKEFYPPFTATDLINLPKYSMYLRLMIDGTTSKPFSAMTLPIAEVTSSYKTKIVEYSRMKYPYGKKTAETHVVSLNANSTQEKRQINLFDFL